MIKPSTGIEILADSTRGIYIPQHFVQTMVDGWTITEADKAILLAGPDNELYWDVWDHVLNTARLAVDTGIKYRGMRTDRFFHLHQDGDLFAVCSAELSEEERANFFGC